MKKMISLFLCAVMAFAMAGCGAAPASGGSSQASEADGDVVTIRFMNWGMAEETTIPAFEAMIAAFNESHPNIRVESVTEAYNSYLDQALILNASNEMPDCLQVHNSMFSALAGAGALADINEYIPDDVRSDFYPNLMDALNYDGKQFGLPWAPSSIVLYCNMDLLGKAGYDHTPTTMTELREMAAAVAALGSDSDGNTLYGLGLQTKALDTTGYYFLPYIWNFGGDMCDADGNITINSEATAEAFTFAKGLVEDGIVPVGQEIKDLRNMFANDQIAFITDSAFGYAAVQSMTEDKEAFNARTQMCGVPSDSGEPINFFIAHNLAVSEQSEHKEEAYTFIEWLTSEEAIEIYNTYSSNIMPCRASVEDLPYYSAEGNEYTQVYIEQLPSARALPEKYSGFKASMLDIANALQRVIINNEDVNVVLNELESQLKTDYVK